MKNLRSANLSEADLSEAELSGAYLREVNLNGANLSGAILIKAELEAANLSSTDLLWADLSGTNLYRTDLSNADLVGVRGLEVDSNRILHARFSPRANDKWSILRRTYTGPNMVLNLLFTLLFFAPLVVKGGGFAILNEAQQRVIESANRIEGYKLSIACNEPQGAISGTVHGVKVSVPCRAEPMWRLLLGFGGPYGIIMPILTGLLIAYQITRYLLTRQISLMRDAEERSGVSPPKDGLLAYPRLYRIHQVLSIIFWIAAAAFVIRAYEFLFLSDVIYMGAGR